MPEEERPIILFKYFIEFLKIWGQENYGENVEIDWYKALKECQKFHLFDFNESLENVIYAKTDEEFRDLAFKWVENQVLDGWAIWRMFKLSPWLLQKLEEEYTEEQIRLQSIEYKKHKCYRCKYFKDHAGWFKDTIDGKKTISVEDALPPENEKLHWRYECEKRKQLLEENPSKSLFKEENCFEYKKFNNQYRKWQLDVEDLHDCPYFEEGGMDWPTYVKHTFGVEI